MRLANYVSCERVADDTDGVPLVKVGVKWWGWPILLYRSGALRRVMKDVPLWQYPGAIAGLFGVWWRLATGGDSGQK